MGRTLGLGGGERRRGWRTASPMKMAMTLVARMVTSSGFNPYHFSHSPWADPDDRMSMSSQFVLHYSLHFSLDRF